MPNIVATRYDPGMVDQAPRPFGRILMVGWIVMAAAVVAIAIGRML